MEEKRVQEQQLIDDAEPLTDADRVCSLLLL